MYCHLFEVEVSLRENKKHRIFLTGEDENISLKYTKKPKRVKKEDTKCSFHESLNANYGIIKSLKVLIREDTKKPKSVNKKGDTKCSFHESLDEDYAIIKSLEVLIDQFLHSFLVSPSSFA